MLTPLLLFMGRDYEENSVVALSKPYVGLNFISLRGYEAVMAILKADSGYVGIMSKVLELKLPPPDQCSTVNGR